MNARLLNRAAALVALSLGLLATSAQADGPAPAAAAAPAAPVAAPVPENLTPAQAEGRQLYGVHCIYCHGAGPGRAGTTALARRVGKDRAVLEARDDLDRAYVQYVVRHGLNAMLPLRRTELTDAELGRIVDWLQRPRVAQAASGAKP